MSSFRKQYGIRLTEDDIPWGEFVMLLAGIIPDTPLGQIVSIRAETDPEMLKCFNEEQRRIHDEWEASRAEQMDSRDYDRAMASFSALFRGFLPKGGDGKCRKA